ncbi:MAG: hypothetical protein JJE40_16085, partial [Vicinamibacteria bacterium]|nr:hypothetical protein [Vicinamibacteria bacterium]
MTIRQAVTVGRSCSLALLAASAVLATACTTLLPRHYEYDEEVNLSLDGSATVYINGSVPAFVALHGIDLDTRPSARLDRAAVRQFFTSEVAALTRLSTSRRNGRRFIHLRLAVNDVGRLPQSAPFSWATYKMQRRGGQYVYTQTVGAAVGRQVGEVGWRGDELVAFRMHLPARILYHDAPSKQVERGNILVWEQTLADRLKGTPVHIEARMESQSILYSAITLFGAMAAVVIVLFAGIIWWIVRKG